MSGVPAHGSAIGRRLARRALAVVAATPEPATHDAPLDLTVPAPEQPPAVVAAAATGALDRGETHYTARAGILPLREALAERLTADGFPTSAESVVVTNGGSEALYVALQSLVKPGDRVLLAGPTAPNIARIVAFAGGETVQLPTTAANRFAPTTAELAGAEAAILLLGSPSPVTGVAVPPDELAALVAAAAERGATVILDRSLAWSAWDPALARYPAGAPLDGLLIAGSFTIPYEMAGWRIGYFAAPAGQAGAALDLKEAMSICTGAVTQAAALGALTGADDWLATEQATRRARHDAVLRRLDEAGLFVVPSDAWPWLLLDTRLIHPDDSQAAALLREQAGVAVEPASPYSPSLAGYTRLTLAAGDATLDEGLDRLLGFHASCF